MFQIQHCSDVFVDACVRNEAGALVFISVYGRDTAVKELIARIQMGTKSMAGLPELKLKGFGEHSGQQHTVFIANPRDLDKLSGRLPKCLYGNLTHMWIFDPAIRSPNKGAGQAWLIEPLKRDASGKLLAIDSDCMAERIWQAVCQLASIPLLPHWREPVLVAIWEDMVTELGRTDRRDFNPRFSEPLGDVVAFRVNLTDTFSARVSGLIRERILTLEANAGTGGVIQRVIPVLPAPLTQARAA